MQPRRTPAESEKLPSRQRVERVLAEIDTADSEFLSLADCQKALNTLLPAISNQAALRQAFEAARTKPESGQAPPADKVSKMDFNSMMHFALFYDSVWPAFDRALSSCDNGRLTIKAFSDACTAVGYPLSLDEAATVSSICAARYMAVLLSHLVRCADFCVSERRPS